MRSRRSLPTSPVVVTVAVVKREPAATMAAPSRRSLSRIASPMRRSTASGRPTGEATVRTSTASEAGPTTGKLPTAATTPGGTGQPLEERDVLVVWARGPRPHRGVAVVDVLHRLRGVAGEAGASRTGDAVAHRARVRAVRAAREEREGGLRQRGAAVEHPRQRVGDLRVAEHERHLVVGALTTTTTTIPTRSSCRTRPPHYRAAAT